MHARLHVLLSSASNQAIVIRRGPSEQVAVIGWNRDTNKFTLGQWFKGRIYSYRCDISPNGKHWIYFAMSDHGDTWTVVARTPYLKALDFYRKDDAWNGGGLFISDKLYWLNEGYATSNKAEQLQSSLKMTPNYPNHTNSSGECPGVYFIRLQRDGWTKGEWVEQAKYDTFIPFTKRINDYWTLVKIFHATLNHPVGKGVYYEEHKLVNKTGEEVACPDWEWADIDKDRIIYAEKGKLMVGRVNKDYLSTTIELYDFNDMKFEAIKAPY